MGKQLRPSLPGCAFHITTRLQDRAHRFTAPLRDRVVHHMALHVARSDVALLAYVVMTNHLHLVLVQGRQPLSRLMQPFLRSVALSIQKAHGLQGHVFERRYRDRICRDAAHLRNAIAYTHANPVRAGLCAEPGDYRWSSYELYVRPEATQRLRIPRVAVDTVRGLRAFSSPGSAQTTSAHQDHAAFVALIAAQSCESDDERQPGQTTDRSSDDAISAAEERRSGGGSLVRPHMDAIADEILSPEGLHLGALQSRWGPRSRLRARAALALECSRAGYTGREIARFLHVSEPTVSRMLVAAVSPAGADAPNADA